MSGVFRNPFEATRAQQPTSTCGTVTVVAPDDGGSDDPVNGGGGGGGNDGTGGGGNGGGATPSPTPPAGDGIVPGVNDTYAAAGGAIALAGLIYVLSQR